MSHRLILCLRKRHPYLFLWHLCQISSDFPNSRQKHIQQEIWKKTYTALHISFLSRDATQSAVMRQYVICLSLCPSVRDVQVCFSHGGAEHARPENDEPQKLQGLKMQDLEDDGPCSRAWKCRTRKWRTKVIAKYSTWKWRTKKITRPDNAGPENDGPGHFKAYHYWWIKLCVYNLYVIRYGRKPM